MRNCNIDHDQLNASLHYLHVGELRCLCENLYLSVKVKKIYFINRIMHFFRTGEKISLKKYPPVSVSKDRDKAILINFMMGT